MELLELCLILLACVIVSAVMDQVISRMSLPLLQIGVGLVLAILLPQMAEVHVDEEVFMTLFIAPMLFQEAKETDRRALWANKWSVLSMAIALVIVSVLAAGYVMHWIIPSIPLAAAFACAAALGPTDAAAVSALGSTVSLTKRQSTLLSGEALINDASGVVSFQFAIAAAVTGAFSLAEATGTFMILFFGGIGLGVLLGFLVSWGMNLLRRLGYVSTIIHVLYEVLTPFVFYLLAEAVDVSGILTVVAAGLVMQPGSRHLATPESSRQKMVSDSFWEVIIFLINGIIFVMLGMQLPKVMQAKDMEGIPVWKALLTIFAVTLTILVIRFLWLMGMELLRVHRGESGCEDHHSAVREALVTTLAGPKGAVTLSIILTIPLWTVDGVPFPHRDLIIFLTSGIILCTLLLANFALPKLAPKAAEEGDEEQMQQARILVLKGVVRELGEMIEENPDSEFAPAGRLVRSRYKIQLRRLQFADDEGGAEMQQLLHEVISVQQDKAREILEQKEQQGTPDPLYNEVLARVRATLGYFDGMENFETGSTSGHKKAARKAARTARKSAFRLRRKKTDQERAAQLYYDACLTAIELEQAAIDYLKAAGDSDNPERKQAAKILLGEHRASLRSLQSRIGAEDGENSEQYGISPAELRENMNQQFFTAARYADEAESNALNMELEQISRLRREGKVTESQARELREEVYLMQMNFVE